MRRPSHGLVRCIGSGRNAAARLAGCSSLTLSTVGRLPSSPAGGADTLAVDQPQDAPAGRPSIGNAACSGSTLRAAGTVSGCDGISHHAAPASFPSRDCRTRAEFSVLGRPTTRNEVASGHACARFWTMLCGAHLRFYADLVYRRVIARLHGQVEQVLVQTTGSGPSPGRLGAGLFRLRPDDVAPQDQAPARRCTPAHTSTAAPSATYRGCRRQRHPCRAVRLPGADLVDGARQRNASTACSAQPLARRMLVIADTSCRRTACREPTRDDAGPPMPCMNGPPLPLGELVAGG